MPFKAIATVGPLTISVDASAWAAYESGVFDGCNQTNPDINHAVQVNLPIILSSPCFAFKQ